MAATNKTVKKDVYHKDIFLAGGSGAPAAKQTTAKTLRRIVLNCMLWEDIAYIDGASVATELEDLVPRVEPQIVADLAVEARYEQKLRHVPLFITYLMTKHAQHKKLVAETLEKIINRPDEITEFLAIYWKNGKRPLSSQVKRGLAKAFQKFDEYQLAKWDKKGKQVSLADVMRLVHPKPKDKEQSELWSRLLSKNLATPDTWEVGISAAKTQQEKDKVWERLLKEHKLGALAILRNLRNMSNLDRSLVAKAIDDANPQMLLPINFFAARQAAPDFTSNIENLMRRCAEQYPKLPGTSLMILDTSGSMGHHISDDSIHTRLDVGISVMVLASYMCENFVVYITAGNDRKLEHCTMKVKNATGFGLADSIMSRIAEYPRDMNGGGIFTRQCIDYIRTVEKHDPDRMIVFSDSQDIDNMYSRGNNLPKPFGKNNYIIDVSSNSHGINYKGIWTAEISGWSENFLKFIHYHESDSLN